VKLKLKVNGPQLRVGDWPTRHVHYITLINVTGRPQFVSLLFASTCSIHVQDFYSPCLNRSSISIHFHLGLHKRWLWSPDKSPLRWIDQEVKLETTKLNQPTIVTNKDMNLVHPEFLRFTPSYSTVVCLFASHRLHSDIPKVRNKPTALIFRRSLFFLMVDLTNEQLINRLIASHAPLMRSSDFIS